jgi:hypothetical protein
MHKVLHDIDESHNNDERDGHEQFPVDTLVRKVWLDTHGPGGDLIRIVVMSNHATPRYSAYREYHYGHTDVSVEDITSFTLRSGTIAGTEQAIDDFVGSMPMPLDIPQVVSFCRGIHSPSGARKRLYKAIDPDDNTKMIGVLIEQDSQGMLAQVTWYKTSEASALFHSTPDSLDFDLVKDENGAPSLDPNDIGGWTWHYSTNLGIGLSSPRVTA